MDRNEFVRLADECIERVARWLEEFDPDEVDFSTADGVITLEFSDGEKYILNRQTGSHQMWYAAGVRAWHYNHEEDGTWHDDRDGHELFDNVGKTLSKKLGRELARP